MPCPACCAAANLVCARTKLQQFQSLVHGALQGYIALFDNQNVKLDAILGMSHQDLLDLGIRSYGHRRNIMQALQTYLQTYLQSCEMAAACANEAGRFGA